MGPGKLGRQHQPRHHDPHSQHRVQRRAWSGRHTDNHDRAPFLCQRHGLVDRCLIGDTVEGDVRPAVQGLLDMLHSQLVPRVDRSPGAQSSCPLPLAFLEVGHCDRGCPSFARGDQREQANAAGPKNGHCPAAQVPSGDAHGMGRRGKRLDQCRFLVGHRVRDQVQARRRNGEAVGQRARRLKPHDGKLLAQVVSARLTVPAPATDQVGFDQNALARREVGHVGSERIDDAGHFMARQNRERDERMVAVQDMKVRAAHTHDAGSHAHVSRSRLRDDCRDNRNLTWPADDDLTHLLGDVHPLLLSALSDSPLLSGPRGTVSMLGVGRRGGAGKATLCRGQQPTGEARARGADQDKDQPTSCQASRLLPPRHSFSISRYRWPG